MKSKIIALALAYLTLFPMVAITDVKAENELPYHEKIDNPNYEYVIYDEYSRGEYTSTYLVVAPKGYEFPKVGNLGSTRANSIYVNLSDVEIYRKRKVETEWKLQTSMSNVNIDGIQYFNMYINGSTIESSTHRDVIYSSVNLYDSSGGVVVSKKPVTDSAKLMEMAKTQAVVEMGESLNQDFGTISVVGGIIFGTLFLVDLVRRLTLLGNH